tara:strand:+ start:70 stop:558 length:489 start_codon:yes stop_codon:yes gene_type:complete
MSDKKRCLLAVDVQSFFNPPQGMVHQINQVAEVLPTVATVFSHNEDIIPLEKLTGGDGPEADTTLVKTENIFPKHGYLLPRGVIEFIKQGEFDEVIVSGGHTDANVLATGFTLFEFGIQPVLVPLLCYGNEWYMHSVTTGIWEKQIGKVMESTKDLGIGSIG